jgi:hypothetical protein
MGKKQKDSEQDVQLVRLKRTFISFDLLGASPLIIHAMSEKIKKETLLPSPSKTTEVRRNSPRHYVYDEWLGCLFLIGEKDMPSPPTYLAGLSIWFKNAICTTGMDMGRTKAGLGRHTWVPDTYVPIYGIPEMFGGSNPVRLAGRNRAPDIHLRPILREWACTVVVGFTEPNLNATEVATLMANAGAINGVGDFRQQKGKGSYGQWIIVDKSMPEYKDFERIKKTCGREAQIKAVENPGYFDYETEKLATWYYEEMKARGFEDSRDKLYAVK